MRSSANHKSVEVEVVQAKEAAVEGPAEGDRDAPAEGDRDTFIVDKNESEFAQDIGY